MFARTDDIIRQSGSNRENCRDSAEELSVICVEKGKVLMGVRGEIMGWQVLCERSVLIQTAEFHATTLRHDWAPVSDDPSARPHCIPPCPEGSICVLQPENKGGGCACKKSEDEAH